MASFGGAPKCPKCAKSVYMAEEVKCSGRSYHRQCFTCTTCSKSLESTTVTEHDATIYCKACYTKHFGPKGYGYGVGAGALAHTTTIPTERSSSPAAPPSAPSSSSSSTAVAAEGGSVEQGQRYKPVVPTIAVGGADRCGKCAKAVYLAEKILGAGKVWHKKCFTCSACNKSLDSSNVQDRESTLYCTPCYKKNFGPKGFRGGTGGDMQHTD